LFYDLGYPAKPWNRGGKSALRPVVVAGRIPYQSITFHDKITKSSNQHLKASFDYYKKAALSFNPSTL